MKNGKTMLYALILAIVCLTASATQTALVCPKELSTLTSEPLLAIVVSTAAFDGIILLNCTNCETSPAVGFSAAEFIKNDTRYYCKKDLQVIGLQEGNYTIQASLHNLSNHRLAQATTKGVAGGFDKQAPIIGVKLPTGIVYSGYVNLTIGTDEEAACRIDTNYTNFDLMTIKLPVGGLLRSLLLVLEKGDYKYYVSCRDNAGNTGKTGTIEFTVDPAPTAIITLSDQTPVKAGILEIELIISEPLKQAPSLTVDFDGGPAKAISLTGSQKSWKGYLVIPEAGDDKIGSFHFAGQDLQGQTGTTITSGALFIADTKKPTAPQGLIAESQIDIDLEWHYEGEQIDHYEVYRSLTPGVKPSNYLGQASNTRYTDREVAGGIAYYYRISAVDTAGNQGPMSEEVSAVSTRTTTQQERTAQPQKKVLLNTPLVLKVNSTINLAGNVYLDAEWARISIADNSEARSAAEDTGVMESISNAKAKLDQYKAQLQEMWYMDLEEKEFDKRLNNIIGKIDELRKTTPASISIRERTVAAQAPTPAQFEEAMDAVLLGRQLSLNETKQYKESIRHLQEQYRVSADLLVLEITNLDGTSNNLTLVRKTIKNYGADPGDLQVVEHIPKEFARHVDEIVFITPGHQILESDPIIAWRGATDIKYYVNRRIQIEDAKRTATIVFNEPRKQAQENASSIPTGLATQEQSRLFTQTESIMIIIGLVLVLGLAVYYFVSSGASIQDIRAEQYAREYMAKARKANHEVQTQVVDMEKENEYYYARLALKRGRELMEQHQLGKAVMLYEELKELYPKLESNHKQEIYESCVDLHRSISEAEK
ncbi:MAG: hypothetical protein ABIF10_03990 [Candidatus Woesearchaeota archaeon]